MRDFQARRDIIAARRQQAPQIAQDLRTMEHAMDAAIGAGGRFLATLADARQTTGVAAEIGQPIYTKAGSMLARTIAAYEDLTAMHSMLAQTARDLSIETTAVGPLEEKAVHKQVELAAVA